MLSSERSCPAYGGGAAVGAAEHQGKREMLTVGPWWPWQAASKGSAAPAHVLSPQDNPAEGS